MRSSISQVSQPDWYPKCLLYNGNTDCRPLVGPDKELFKMHKGLLCNASPFFSGAFEGHFVESANQCLNLPEEDPAVFKYLQLWLYSDSILEGEEMPAEISWKTLFDLYRGFPLWTILGLALG